VTDDIAAFLKARLDDDERIARDGSISSIEHIQAWVRDAGPESAEVYLDHFDPARVLRAVEAKRRLIEFHQPFDAEGRTWCGHCGYPPDFTDPYADVDPWPCRHARLLASEWSTHELFR
jgi:hypothetical protein